jgi:hypothetical protein
MTARTLLLVVLGLNAANVLLAAVRTGIAWEKRTAFRRSNR